MLRAALGAVLAAVVLTGCTTSTEEVSTFPGESWERVDPAEAGFDGNALDAIGQRLSRANTSCFLVSRRGKIVHETYAPGVDPDTPGATFSITKSVTSVLVGMAVDDGDLDLDDLAADYIPQWRGTPSEQVTVRHLLSNTSGRHWDDVTDYQKMVFGVGDKTALSIGLGQDAEPGAEWVYNNSAIQALQVVLKVATGVEPADYAQQRLFGPLGMDDTTWDRDVAGHTTMYAGINSTCRDLARFGHLVLRHGSWKNQQIVPADYVDEATARASSKLNTAYGLLWWINRKGRAVGAATALGGGEEAAKAGRLAPHAPANAIWALGAGRQLVGVLPSEAIVAVRLGTEPDDAQTATPDTLTRSILAAMR